MAKRLKFKFPPLRITQRSTSGEVSHRLIPRACQSQRGMRGNAPDYPHLSTTITRSRLFRMAHSADKGYSKTLVKQGAEARVYKTEFYGKPAILKERFVKKYRVASLDQKLTQRRMSQEARSIARCRKHGIRAPAIYHLDFKRREIYMEEVSGELLRDHIQRLDPSKDREELVPLAQEVGRVLAKMHNCNIIHGDLTTSNMIYGSEGKITLIDFGLSSVSGLVEDKGVDLYVLERAFLSSHPNTEDVFRELLQSYELSAKESKTIVAKLNEVRSRGRKRTMVG